LKNIIYFDKQGKPLQEEQEMAQQVEINLIAFSDLLKEGEQQVQFGNEQFALPTQDTHVLLSYTSGSTGIPKAVKVTHKMLVNNCFEFAVQYQSVNFTDNDSFLLFSPLAHISS
jgi:long-subunit acyl-CoA synthetase (AMP-forming)